MNVTPGFSISAQKLRGWRRSRSGLRAERGLWHPCERFADKIVAPSAPWQTPIVRAWKPEIHRKRVSRDCEWLPNCVARNRGIGRDFLVLGSTQCGSLPRLISLQSTCTGLFGCRSWYVRSWMIAQVRMSKDLNRDLTTSGNPWCLMMCFLFVAVALRLACCDMVWCLALFPMSVRMGVRSCSVSIVFAVFVAGNQWGLSPHDRSALTWKTLRKVLVWAADLYESFIRFKGLTSQHGPGSQLTHTHFLSVYIYEINYEIVFFSECELYNMN